MIKLAVCSVIGLFVLFVCVYLFVCLSVSLLCHARRCSRRFQDLHGDVVLSCLYSYVSLTASIWTAASATSSGELLRGFGPGFYV